MDNPPCTISVPIKCMQGRVVWTQLRRRQVGIVDVGFHATLGPKSCSTLFRLEGNKRGSNLPWSGFITSERAWVCVSSTSNLFDYSSFNIKTRDQSKCYANLERNLEREKHTTFLRNYATIERFSPMVFRGIHLTCYNIYRNKTEVHTLGKL